MRVITNTYAILRLGVIVLQLHRHRDNAKCTRRTSVSRLKRNQREMHSTCFCVHESISANIMCVDSRPRVDLESPQLP